MKTQPYLDNRRLSKLVFFACFLAYTASYVGRIDYSAALPAIIESGLFSKSEGGLIGSAFFFVYGGFQIINGLLGDKLSAFKMIITGLSLSAVANVVITFCTSNVQMAVVWGFNGFALSLLWAAILKILANIINDGMRSKACLNITATLPIGTVAAYLIASLSVKYSNWKTVFFSSAFVLTVALVFFIIVYLKAKKEITYREIPLPQNIKKETSVKDKIKLFPLLLAGGIIIILPADAIHGAIKEGITTWVPTMIEEIYNTSVSFSIFISVILPIVNLSGAYIITPIYKKVFKSDEIKTGCAILLFSLIPLTGIIFMKSMPVILCVVLLAVTTTAMHTYNYMIITLLPIRFAPYGRTATVTGIMNASAYVGCAAASYGFGVISDKIGWTGTAAVWVGLCVAALILTAIAAPKWKKFVSSVTFKERENI